MKLILTVALALTLCGLATTASAQAEPGDIGVFFDPAGTISRGIVPVGVPFFYYVVGFDLDGDVFGYEFQVSNPNPAFWFVLSAVPNPPTALDVGPGPDNWIVGTGICVPGGPGPVVLLTINAVAFAPIVDGLVCLSAANPSSFLPPLPGYLTCVGASDIRPFGVAQNGLGVYPNGCGVANPTAAPPPPIATEIPSFGAVKAQFH